MRAMVLAAGRGRRMRPLSDTIPKPLFPVGGYPLIAYPLGLLKAAGITDVVVNVHYLADQIERVLSECAKTGMRVTFSHEAHLLETGGGIANARRLLGEEPFVVINADIICDVDLRAVIEEHVHAGSIATMVLRENPDPERIPVVEWDTMSRRVLDIRGELGVRTRTSRQTMFTGIHVMDPAAFDYLLPMRESIIDGFYLPALREGRHVRGFFHEGYWADLGTLEEYRAVCEEVPRLSFSHFSPLPLPTVDAS